MSYDTVTQRFTGIPAKQINCRPCGLSFAIPEALWDAWDEKDRRVWCPGCGASLSPCSSEADRMRDEVVRVKARLDQAQADAAYLRERAERGDRQIRARKAVATRLRNRIKKGKCPCCSHEFKDLKAHMKTQHPKWNPERAVAALAAK